MMTKPLKSKRLSKRCIWLVMMDLATKTITSNSNSRCHPHTMSLKVAKVAYRINNSWCNNKRELWVLNKDNHLLMSMSNKEVQATRSVLPLPIKLWWVKVMANNWLRSNKWFWCNNCKRNSKCNLLNHRWWHSNNSNNLLSKRWWWKWVFLALVLVPSNLLCSNNNKRSLLSWNPNSKHLINMMHHQSEEERKKCNWEINICEL